MARGKMKVLIIALLIVYIFPSVYAVLAKPVLIGNPSTLECREFIRGDEHHINQIPEGFSFIKNGYSCERWRCEVTKGVWRDNRCACTYGEFSSAGGCPKVPFWRRILLWIKRLISRVGV